jgi:hypothetical protein
LLVPSRALAADPVSAAASAESQALFAEALALMEAGKDVEACPKFEASLRLEPGIGTRFNLAACYEHVGRTASAWAMFRNTEELGGRRPEAAEARKRGDRLEPRLVRVVVDVPEAVRSIPNLDVRRGDVPLSLGQFGTAVPVDPGVITISASAPSRKPWSMVLTATKEGATLTVQVPLLEESRATVATASATASATSSAPRSAPVPPLAVPPDAWGTRKSAGVVLLGVGGVSLIAGAILGALVPVQKGVIDGHCQVVAGTNHCDAQGGAATDAAFALANGSNVTFALAAVLGVTGGGLLLFGGDEAKAIDPAKKAHAGARGLAVGPVVSGDSATLVVRGRW